MKTNEVPEKYNTCDWLWNYGSIGLTREHIKRLNNAINNLESLNEHTDAKYLKEIKNKLLEDIPEPKFVKFNTDAFIKKACAWLQENKDKYLYNTGGKGEYIPTCSGKIIEEFRKYMKGE